MPDWLKNALVLLGVLVVLYVLWSLVEVILTVVLWAVAFVAIGFAVRWLWDKVAS